MDFDGFLDTFKSFAQTGVDTLKTIYDVRNARDRIRLDSSLADAAAQRSHDLQLAQLNAASTLAGLRLQPSPSAPQSAPAQDRVVVVSGGQGGGGLDLSDPKIIIAGVVLLAVLLMRGG